LRNYENHLRRFNPLLKTIAFLLLVILSAAGITGAVRAMHHSVWRNWWWDDIGKTEFTETQRYHNELWSVRNRIENLSRTTEQDIDNYFQDVQWQIREHMAERYSDTITSAEVWGRFQRDYPGYSYFDGDVYWFNDIQWQIIDDMVHEYRNSVVHDDVWEEFTQQYADYIREMRESAEEMHEQRLQGLLGDTRIVFDPDTMSFEFTPEYLAEQNGALARVNGIVNEFIFWAAIWLVGFLATLGYVLYSAGRKSTVEGMSMTRFDRVFCELTLAAAAFVAIGLLFWVADFYNYNRGGGIMFQVVFVTVSALFFAALYALLLSLVRHIKNYTVFTNTLIFHLGRGIYRGTRFLCSRTNPMIKATIAVALLGLLTTLPFMGLLTVPCALFLLYRHLKEYQKIREGVASVRAGNFSGTKIAIKGMFTELSALAEDVNEISAGFGDEIERRLKSERLKTELIVNVSHDIRTPLTSLITYADLLSQEETDNENITKYARIIAQKSGRLKVLTDDLFESAKASSGNIAVELDSVEINALLIQALAEYDDKIKTSGLDFKLKIPEEKIHAYADGRLLWRVIDNLISNTLRYSLENSRVYIDVREHTDENNVYIEMKNISKAELNIPQDEITERFKRGDLARHSEGSGLGLDIASSLMQCQGGDLRVTIDGDLFKVSVRIPVSPLTL
jgi:signal transduction histidine kinase